MTKLEQKLQELGYEKLDNKIFNCKIYSKKFNDCNEKLIFLNTRKNKIENSSVAIYKRIYLHYEACKDLEKDLEELDNDR